MTLDLKDLRLIDTVAQHGTLTRAAPALFLTQSALSRQLADLERRLGTPLFVRQRKRMVLSPAGERLCEHARSILKEVQRAEDEVRQVGKQRAAVLRLSTECYTCYHWLPPVLMEYRRHHSDVEIRIVPDATRRPLPALARGQLDVVVASSDASSRRFSAIDLFSDEMVAIIPPDHAWAGREQLSPSDFATEHLFTYTVSPSELTFFREFLMPAGVAPQQYTQVELTEAMIELVKAGLGVAVLARWAVAPYVKAGQLKTVRLGKHGLHRQWKAVTLRSRRQPEHLTAFVDVLHRKLQTSTAPLRLISNK